MPLSSDSFLSYSYLPRPLIKGGERGSHPPYSPSHLPNSPLFYFSDSYSSSDEASLLVDSEVATSSS